MKVKNYWVIIYHAPGTFCDMNSEYVVEAKTPGKAVNKFYKEAENRSFLRTGCKVLSVKPLDVEVA